MSFDFDQAIRDAEKAGYVQGGDRFKIQEGANRIRIVAEPVPHQGSYQGRPNFKWLVYIIDRADGRVKLFFMPHTIAKAVRDLQKSDDYAFEGLPPFDITIQAKNAGTKEVEYTVVPARKNTPITEDEFADLAKKKSLKDVHRALKEKEAQQAPPAEDPTRDAPLDPDEVPL